MKHLTSITAALTLAFASAGAFAQTTAATTTQRDVNQQTRIESGHNAVTGNPDSVSSRRLQADVARNANQDKRIENGIQNGSLTNHEVSRLDRGQARVDRREANAAANGHVGAGEQRRIQRSENHQSNRIHRQKHDAQVRG